MTQQSAREAEHAKLQISYERHKIILPIVEQREQVVDEPTDPYSACAVDIVRVLAREISSDHMGGAKKGKGAMP